MALVGPTSFTPSLPADRLRRLLGEQEEQLCRPRVCRGRSLHSEDEVPFPVSGTARSAASASCSEINGMWWIWPRPPS